jgi:5-methylcytosine-specific restriction endonuclease McrA
MTKHIPEKLRKFVAKRAQYRCEYCHIHEKDAYFTHQIEHIISRKHGGATSQDNLAYACTNCNSNKGTDIATMLLPDKSLVRLFNPREHIWKDHFQNIDCVFYAKSSIGEATIKILKFNAVERIIERRLIEQ